VKHIKKIGLVVLSFVLLTQLEAVYASSGMRRVASSAGAKVVVPSGARQLFEYSPVIARKEGQIRYWGTHREAAENAANILAEKPNAEFMEVSEDPKEYGIKPMTYSFVHPVGRYYAHDGSFYAPVNKYSRDSETGEVRVEPAGLVRVLRVAEKGSDKPLTNARKAEYDYKVSANEDVTPMSMNQRTSYEAYNSNLAGDYDTLNINAVKRMLGQKATPKSSSSEEYIWDGKKPLQARLIDPDDMISNEDKNRLIGEGKLTSLLGYNNRDEEDQFARLKRMESFENKSQIQEKLDKINAERVERSIANEVR